VKRIALLLVLVSACKTVAVNESVTTGAATPRAAVERFVAAARMQDVQAVGAVFGDEKGPMRDHTDRQQMEQRSIIMLTCLRHDKAVISNPVPEMGGRQTATVEFTQGKLTGSTQFTVARGPGNRWYVFAFDITAMQNKGFCGKTGG
jgi:hypothetical protein